LSGNIDTVINETVDTIKEWADNKFQEKGDYVTLSEVDEKLESTSAWASDTFTTTGDIEEVITTITGWADDTFVTSANLVQNTQYALTTSGWREVYNTPNFVAGEGIIFRDGTGIDAGKTFVEVDNTNYKLLTNEEYAQLTAAVDIISTYSARWVLGPADEGTIPTVNGFNPTVNGDIPVVGE